MCFQARSHRRDGAVTCSSVRRHTLSGRCNSGVPRSVKRRSLTVLPDAALPEFGPEAEDCAFADQVGDICTQHFISQWIPTKQSRKCYAHHPTSGVRLCHH
jgi:hypothetical protein